MILLPLLVSYDQLIAQNPAIDNVPPIPPFSKTIYWEPEHISDYTWKKYNKVNLKQVLEKLNYNQQIDSGRIINFDTDGWIRNTIENKYNNRDYEFYKKLTEIKEIKFSDNRFIIKSRITYFYNTNTKIYNISNEMRDVTTYFNSFGLIEKSVSNINIKFFDNMKDKKDTLIEFYNYDRNNRIIYTIYFLNRIKGDTGFSPVKYKYLNQNDTVIVLEYTGNMDSIVSYSTGNLEFYKSTGKSSYNLVYVYYFDKNGKLLEYEIGFPEKNTDYITINHFLYYKSWHKFKANLLEEMRDLNLKFIYY